MKLLRMMTVLFLVGALSPAFAEDVAPAPPDTTGRVTGFEAAKTPTKVPGGPLLLTAYALLWAVLFGYLVSIWRRQLTVKDELADLVAEMKAIRKAVGVEGVSSETVARGGGGGDGDGDG